MPKSFQSSDEKGSDHSIYHSENKEQPQEAEVTYDAQSRNDNLEVKLPAVPEQSDDTYPEFCLKVASTSSSSSYTLLGVFDQKHNEKEKPMMGNYQEFSIEAAWKHQALLESMGPKNRQKTVKNTQLLFELRVL
jgi:hypothetical protein